MKNMKSHKYILIQFYKKFFSSDIKIIILIFILSMIIRLILFSYVNYSPYTNDGKEYLEWGYKIPNFSLFFFVCKKPPLYSLFLGIFHYIGINDGGIIFLQICIDSVNQILFYLICRNFAVKVFSFWASFAYLINISLIIHSFSFQTETLSVFLLMSHVLILLKYKDIQNKKLINILYILNTIFIILVKASLIYIVLLDLLYFILYWRKKIFIIIPIFSVLILCFINYKSVGEFTTSRYASYNIAKVSRFSMYELKDSEVPNEYVPFLNKYKIECNNIENDTTLESDFISSFFFDKIRLYNNFPLLSIIDKEPNGLYDISKIYSKIALISIKKHPLEYIKAVVISCIHYCYGPIYFSGYYFFKIFILIIFIFLNLLFFYKFFINFFKKNKMGILPIIIVLNFFVSNLMECGENQRYSIIVIPLMIIYLLYDLNKRMIKNE